MQLYKKISVTIDELPSEFVLSADYVFKTNEWRVSFFIIFFCRINIFIFQGVTVAVADDLRASRYMKHFTFSDASCVPSNRKPLNPFSASVQTKGACGPSGCC